MKSESGFKRVRNEYNEVSVDIASILKMKKNTEVKTDSLLINPTARTMSTVTNAK